MRYLGGKSKIAKKLTSVILNHTSNRERYIEPFIGSGSMLASLSPHFKETIAADIHPDLILMWKFLQSGKEIPRSITLEQYNELRTAPPSAIRGFAGFGCSFGGKWFGGYARGGNRNYADETARGLERDISRISKLTSFINIDYKEIEVKPTDVIYCDPPYADTTGYSNDFDSKQFWKIMDKWSDVGAHVYISEYKAPSNWKTIWELTKNRDLRGDLHTSEKITEKLFTKGVN